MVKIIINDTLFINGQILKMYKISNYYSVIKTYFFIKILILLSHKNKKTSKL